MQSLVVRTTAESGDGIIRFRSRRQKDKMRVPLQIQALEGDYLDASRTTGTSTSPIVMGVQFSLIGQRERYWLYDDHPGGMYTTNSRELGFRADRFPQTKSCTHTACCGPGRFGVSRGWRR